MAANTRNQTTSSNNNINRRSSSRGESIVHDVGRRRSSCGYCKSGGRTSFSHGLWAQSITVDDYQDLLDRGWRRSGCFLYKPDMEKTCCPSYTIRLKAGDFAPSKGQLRLSRRMQRFLDGTLDGKKTELCTDGSSTSKSAAKHSFSCNSEEKNKEEEYLKYLSIQIDNMVNEWTGSCDFPSDIQLPKASVKKMTRAKKKQNEDFEDLLYSSSISFQVAAILKRSKLPEKTINDLGLSRYCMGMDGQSSEISPTTIAERLSCYLNKLGKISGLPIRACNGHLNFYSAVKHASSGEGDRTNDFNHTPRSDGSKRSCTIKNSEFPPHKKRKLEIRLKRSTFDPEEYALYRKYQIRVHNDTLEHVEESAYKRFLVDTPLVFVPPSGNDTVPPCGFGSFHQQYLVDGQLVAVGVVDILPKCMSSKYLFWDPDLAFLSLGKYSALQEIGWVKENQVHCPSLQYYYLGYYIHSCSKMRYKAAYRPSELLCPLRYKWVSFDIARPLLDKKSYVVLSNFANIQNEDSSQHVVDNRIEPQHYESDDDDMEMMDPDFEGSEDDSDPDISDVLSDNEITVDASNILVGLKNTRVRFQDLRRALGSREGNYLEVQLHRYMKAVGPGPSERMVYTLG